jgi:DNA-binding protein YbaB
VTDADLGMAELDRLLEQTRRSLEQVRAAGAADPAAPDVRGTGVGADGQITAVARPGGHLESLRMDPRALRMGSEALCEQIVAAVNAALDDLRANAGQPPAQAGVDTAALAARMSELQSQSARQMAAFTQGISDVLARIRSSTGTGQT